MGENNRERFYRYWEERLEEEMDERLEELRQAENSAINAFRTHNEAFFLDRGFLNYAVQERLLERNLDDNDYSGSMLHFAAFHKMPKILKRLLEYGVDPNRKDSNDKYPISYTIDNDDVLSTRLLIEAGYPLTKEDLKYATLVGSKKVLKYILSKLRSNNSQEMRRYVCELQNNAAESVKDTVQENCKRRAFETRAVLAAIYNARMKRYRNKAYTRHMRKLFGNIDGGKRNKTRRVKKRAAI